MEIRMKLTKKESEKLIEIKEQIGCSTIRATLRCIIELFQELENKYSKNIDEKKLLENEIKRLNNFIQNNKGV